MATKLFYNRDARGRQIHHRITPVATGSISQLNRHTGQPHEHKREMARRERQDVAIFDRNVSEWQRLGTYQDA